MSDWIVRGTIWIALAAFVAAEGGRWRASRRRRPVSGLAEPKLAAKDTSEGWASRVFLLGALICGAHFLAALHWHHDWSHARAIEFTAAQTKSVYGFGWGGGFWINYVFLAVWLSEAVWWLSNPEQAIARPSAVRWWLRAFYAIVIVNAAVIFTTGAAQLAGTALVVFLVVLWWPQR